MGTSFPGWRSPPPSYWYCGTWCSSLNQPANDMDKTVHHQSLPIFYRTEGPGGAVQASAPLLLLHGFAEDGRIWDGQVEYLKEDHRLLIPDLPGSGRSSPLPGPTSMEELADAV